MGQRKLIREQLEQIWDNPSVPQKVKDDLISQLGKKERLEWKVKFEELETESFLTEERPGWEIPAEVQQMLDLYKGTGEEMRGVAGEALDIAKLRTERQKEPGADIFTQQVLTAGATARERAMQATGGGISGLGSISDIFQTEVGALQQQAARNLAYRDQAEKDLQLSLGTFGQTLAQTAQLEGMGLEKMTTQKEQKFQINELDPYYDVLNYKTAKLGVFRSELEALKQRRAQLWGEVIGTVGKVGQTIAMV